MGIRNKPLRLKNIGNSKQSSRFFMAFLIIAHISFLVKTYIVFLLILCFFDML